MEVDVVSDANMAMVAITTMRSNIIGFIGMG